MSDHLTRYIIRYPHARTTTLQYLAKREETTKRLMMEIEAKKRPVHKPSATWVQRARKALEIMTGIKS